MAAKVDAFRTHLQEFALKHRADIQKDPVFRAQFHEMCASVGVDPLASNKGFWTEMLGFGDFYYELAVQIGEQGLIVHEPLSFTLFSQLKRASRLARTTAG